MKRLLLAIALFLPATAQAQITRRATVIRTFDERGVVESEVIDRRPRWWRKFADLVGRGHIQPGY